MDFPFSVVKEHLQPLILSSLLHFFSEQELLQGDIINTNYDASLVSSMHILKKLTFPGIRFSMIVSLFHGSTRSDSYVEGTVFIS